MDRSRADCKIRATGRLGG